MNTFTQSAGKTAENTEQKENINWNWKTLFSKDSSLGSIRLA